MTHRFTVLVSLALVAGCSGAHTGATIRAAQDDPELALAAAALAERRAVALDRLHAYGAAEIYPVDAAGMPDPVFRDARGVRCPMSELIYRSGRADLVDAVVARNNRLRLADVTEGPLLAWMQESGLTRDEIIAIQGVMDFEYSFQIPVEGQGHQFEIALATGAVTAKLDGLEESLRAATPRSIRTAATKLTRAQRARLAAGRSAGAKSTQVAVSFP